MVFPGGVVVIVALAFTLGTGLFLSLVACFMGETGWPMMSLGLNLAAVLILFVGGLAERVADDTPSFLQSTTEDNWYDFGWYVFGVLVFSAFACPLLLAETRIVSMRVSWVSTISSWMTAATVLLVSILYLKIRMREEGKLGDDSGSYGDDDDEDDNDKDN